MGRPLNKKFFGDPAKPGSQIEVQYWDTTTGISAAGYIVKQLGARRFRCTNGTTDTSDCRLAETVTQEGDMVLALANIGSDTGAHVAMKISGRTATLETDEKVAWTHANLADTNTDGSVDITALNAGSTYKIATVTDGDWTLIGASTGTVGEIFTATGAGTGTGDTATFVSSDVPEVTVLDNPKPKKYVVEKVTKAVKDIVQDKPKVEEPKKTYKPRAKKAPAKKTTQAKTSSKTKTDSEE